MLRRAVYRFCVPGGFVSAGLLPFTLNDHDQVKIDTKTVQSMYEEAPGDKQTGVERLQMMFTIDEFGRVSSELNSIYQAGFLGFLFGACYGGFVNSRVAYMNFLERNQATAFQSSFEAKKKLQDQVTLNFAKGAFRWGWRLALFTTSYVGIQTVVSVYRGKSSLYEYLAAGGVTGAMYKFSMGLRGMASGGLVGLALGGLAGGLSLGIMRATGTTMEEVRFWQYKWHTNREQAIRDSMKKQTDAEEEPLLTHHHNKFGTANLDLDAIEAEKRKIQLAVERETLMKKLEQEEQAEAAAAEAAAAASATAAKK
ncbi:RPII140-upstream gene protein [Anopheles gambiae]|uniref:RPII140-upstream gene protein n=1 Tax=Anopheles coluzzii TaxID=1518534 RepID=UPI0020FFA895|nr:RPII140-upstream gene protein [Anopheles coluzzii]XP_321704.6 RPII140-upstream gene protein [Anopheles gambiae]